MGGLISDVGSLIVCLAERFSLFGGAGGIRTFYVPDGIGTLFRFRNGCVAQVIK